MDKKVQFYPANSLWIKQGLDVSTDYQNTVKEKYLSEVYEKPFDNQTVNEINQWVSDRTKGKITQIVDDLEDYVAVLINAIYFYGQWLDQFAEENTTTLPFYVDSTQTVDAEMMVDDISYMRIGENDTLTVGELFYGKGNYSMVVIVPKDGYSLFQLVHSINATTFEELVKNTTEGDNVHVILPKFKFKFSYKDLKDQLTQLGLSSLFSPAADLDDINSGIYIDKVIQKTFIEVNEQGTEAAAVTAALARYTAAPTQILLKADHPFLYAIRETTTGVILFLGTIVNPTGNE